MSVFLWFVTLLYLLEGCLITLLGVPLMAIVFYQRWKKSGQILKPVEYGLEKYLRELKRK